MDLVENGLLTMAGQILKERLGSQLKDCLSECLAIGRAKPSSTHYALADVPWVAVLTTNFDCLIESTYTVHSGGVQPIVASRDDYGYIYNLLRVRRFFVYKIHGDVKTSQELVLGDRDYDHILYNSPGYLALLDSIFSAFSILFIGYGGTDPNLSRLMDKLSALSNYGLEQHYILTPKDRHSPLERKRLAQDRGLLCIPYDKDSNHSQVGSFLRTVKERTSVTYKKKTPKVFVFSTSLETDSLESIVNVVKKLGYEVRSGSSIVAERIKSIKTDLSWADIVTLVITRGERDEAELTSLFETTRDMSKGVVILKECGAKLPGIISSSSAKTIQCKDISLDHHDRELLSHAIQNFVEDQILVA